MGIDRQEVIAGQRIDKQEASIASGGQTNRMPVIGQRVARQTWGQHWPWEDNQTGDQSVVTMSAQTDRQKDRSYGPWVDRGQTEINIDREFLAWYGRRTGNVTKRPCIYRPHRFILEFLVPERICLMDEVSPYVYCTMPTSIIYCRIRQKRNTHSRPTT